MNLPVFEQEARSILSPTSGFLAEAGFTHSLTPARNCTFGCTYCYVPTMRLRGGLKPDDWQRWGQFTTFKSNAAELLARQLRPRQRIYCSPLVDPYQPAEQQRQLMPAVLDSLIAHAPEVFCLQTRGPLVLRDVALLQQLSARTSVRISFSLTTDRDDVQRWYEPHCASFEARLAAMRELCRAGLRVHATLAPLLPCHPERLAHAALEASNEDVLCDPFHVRATKPNGATTRPQADAISRVQGFTEWHDPAFQAAVAARIATIVHAAGQALRHRHCCFPMAVRCCFGGGWSGCTASDAAMRHAICSRSVHGSARFKKNRGVYLVFFVFCKIMALR